MRRAGGLLLYSVGSVVALKLTYSKGNLQLE